MSFLSAAQASSSNSQSINSGSLSFNPIISLDSPESSIRQDNPVDQTTRFSDTSSSSTARAKATLSTTGGGDGESDGSEGFGAGVGLSSNRGSQGSGPYNLSGDLIPGVSGGILSGNSGLLLLGGLAIAAFFLAKKFL